MKQTRCNRVDVRMRVHAGRAMLRGAPRRWMMPSLPARVLATALVTLLAACSPLQPPRAEEPVLHVLDVRPAVARATTPRDLVLEVGAPRAAPGFDSAALVYVQKPFVLDAFATHRWADTPARMIEAPLMRALEQTGLFRAVVPAPSGVPADLRLDTDLLRLQHNFASRPSRVELSLRFRLSDLRGRRVVAARVIDLEVAAASDDPAGGVDAANAALANALAQAAAFAVTAAAEGLPPAKGTP
jgi:cholesterol transport system auxiliary component